MYLTNGSIDLSQTIALWIKKAKRFGDLAAYLQRFGRSQQRVSRRLKELLQLSTLKHG